ncbi:MAG: hypothetical protein Q9188_003899 [Gyalolechia gomerana]
MVRTSILSSSQLTASSYESQASSSQWHALTDSQYPSVAVQAFIDLLSGLGDDLHVVAGRVSIFHIDVPAIVTPNNQADPVAGNPGDPFRREGLAQCLYEECESELRTAHDGANPSATWKTMLDDRDNGTYYVVIYLMMLPDYIIEALIRGTLAYELKYNPEVARYRIYMKPRNIPGIYLNIVAHGKWLVLSSCGKDPDQGKWLSAIELKKLLQSYTTYIENTEAAANDAADCQFKGQAGTRRWAKNERQKRISKERIEEIRSQVTALRFVLVHGDYNCTWAGIFDISLAADDIAWDHAKQAMESRLKYCKAPDGLVAAALDLEDRIAAYHAEMAVRENLGELKGKISEVKAALDAEKQDCDTEKEKLREAFLRNCQVRDTRSERLRNTNSPSTEEVQRARETAESAKRIRQEYDPRVKEGTLLSQEKRVERRQKFSDARLAKWQQNSKPAASPSKTSE